MATKGHEEEILNVENLKFSLQKMKTDIVDKKYTLPQGGVPKSDLSEEVQNEIESGGAMSEQIAAEHDAWVEALRSEAEARAEENGKKVDAIPGKGLSTNDYTDEDKQKLSDLPTNAELQSELGDKQGTIADLQQIRERADEGHSAYQMPQDGIPSEDLSAAVQTLLELARTALQSDALAELNRKVGALEAYFDSEADSDNIINKWNEIVAFLSGISEGGSLQQMLEDLSTQIGQKVSASTLESHINNTNNPHSVTKEQVGLGKVGNFKAVSTEQDQGLSGTEKENARNNIGAGTSNFSGSWGDLSDRPELFSGDYNDLGNKPTIPDAQIQSDWNQSDETKKDFIKNKPTIPINTDTKVTSVDNHYAPVANAGSELTASIDGEEGTYSLGAEYSVVTGVKAQRDAKGHVVGLKVTKQKVKDTNTHTEPTGAEVKNALKTGTADGTFLSKAGTWINPLSGLLKEKVTVRNISSSLNAQNVSTNIADGESETVIFVNTNEENAELTVSVNTSYKTPLGTDLVVACPVGGYCEINFINVNGTIYARGI